PMCHSGGNMRTRHLLLACCTAMLTGSVLGQTQPHPEPAVPPFYTEAADCTAAFQARVIQRLTQPKSDSRNKAILRDTESGFIFIGVAYKEGLRNPAADQMLKAAEKRWAQLTRAEQDKRLATCGERAKVLMDDVTTI